ncbi:MAG: hypothetical protein R3F59_35470 [Myxococcota bacterium]
MSTDAASPGEAWLVAGPFAGGQRSLRLDAAVTFTGRAPGDEAGCGSAAWA